MTFKSQGQPGHKALKFVRKAGVAYCQYLYCIQSVPPTKTAHKI